MPIVPFEAPSCLFSNPDENNTPQMLARQTRTRELSPVFLLHVVYPGGEFPKKIFPSSISTFSRNEHTPVDEFRPDYPDE